MTHAKTPPPTGSTLPAATGMARPPGGGSPAVIPSLLGLSEIAPLYDAFIIDMWGVIHDGATAYPHSAGTLSRLRAMDKPTVLLSNAPRRAHTLIATMDKMGLSRWLYGDVVSSGEAVNYEMRVRRDPFYAGLGRRVWHLGPGRDDSVFDGLDVERVATPEEAEFVVNTGPQELDETVADYEPLLQRCAARQLPMVCANPDHVVIREGQRVMCAGAMAARYEELGGRVSYRGKPDATIYDLCLERLGLSDRRRVLAVGDALETDVAGAAAAGIDLLFVTGGIHGVDLGVGYDERADPGRVTALLAAHGLSARAFVPAFVW